MSDKNRVGELAEEILYKHTKKRWVNPRKEELISAMLDFHSKALESSSDVEKMAIDNLLQDYLPTLELLQVVAEIVQSDMSELGIEVEFDQMQKYAVNYSRGLIDAVIDGMLTHLDIGYKAAKQSSAIVWVKASERLPNDNEKVLVCKRTGHITIATYYEFDQFKREKMFVGIGGAHYDLTWIIYWMPLPNNPDESNTSAIVESEEKNYEPEVRNTNEASVVSLPCTVGNSIKVPKTKTEFIEWINKDFESTIKNYALIEKKDLGWCINGIHVLKTMCEKAGLNAGVASSEQLIETLESLLNNSNHQ